MAQVSTNEFKKGLKVEIDGEPYLIVDTEFVKPGKGSPFNRVKLKHLKTKNVIERTFKSGEKLDLADVEDLTMRLLYREGEDFVFMDEKTYEQHRVPLSIVEDLVVWCKEDIEYNIVFYKGEIIDFIPPTFMEMTIAETAPGLRGDTSGRVLKSAVTDTGAKIQVPIFIEEGEKIKVDTRDGKYVSRM